MATALAISCDVCMHDFNDADRKSVVLPCGHDFCLTCLVRLKTSGSHKCPKCRGDWAELEVEALPGMLVILNDKAEEEITVGKTKKGDGLCKKHHLSYVFWYREQKEFFCNKCVVEMSSLSKLELIDDAIPEIKTDLSERVAAAAAQIVTDFAELDQKNIELDGKLLQIRFIKEKIEELERGIGEGIKRVKSLKAANLNASVLVEEIERKINKINSDLDISTILDSRAVLEHLSKPNDLPSAEESKSLLCNIAYSYAEAANRGNCPSEDTFVQELLKALKCTAYPEIWEEEVPFVYNLCDKNWYLDANAETRGENIPKNWWKKSGGGQAEQQVKKREKRDERRERRQAEQQVKKREERDERREGRQAEKREKKREERYKGLNLWKDL